MTEYAGFWIRAVADFIDSTLLDIASALVELMILGGIYWVGILTQPQGQSVASSSVLEVLSPFALQALYMVLRGVLSFPYYTWGHFKYGTTLGKRVCKVYVVQAEGLGPLTLKQSALRTVCYILSYLPLGAGFLMVAFHPQKKGLHDLLTGTLSVRRK